MNVEQIVSIKSISEIIISGTYGFSTIALTVFSIISSYVNNKTIAFKSSKLLRFNLFIMFIPILLHTLYLILSVYFPVLRSIGMISIESSIIILIIFVHSTFILEPYYNIDSFKKTVIKSELSRLKKNIINSEYIDVNTIIAKEVEYIAPNINGEKEINGLSISYKDAHGLFKDLFLFLIKNRANIAETDFLNTMYLLKEYIFDNYNKIDEYDIDNMLKIKYLLKIVDDYNEIGDSYDFHSFIFDKISLLRIDKNSDTDERMRLDYIISLLKYKIEKNANMFSNLVKYLFIQKRNMYDAYCFSMFYGIIIENPNKVACLDDKCMKRITYFYKVVKNEIECNETFGAEFDEYVMAIKSILGR